MFAFTLPIATLTISGSTIGNAQAACTAATHDTVSPGCGGPSPTPTPAASPSPSPSSTGVSGVSMGSDGWITYSDSETSRLGVTGTVTTINGTVQSDGTCQFDYDFTGSSSSPVYQQELGYNPSTCQERVLTGSISAADEASLTSPTDTNDVAETPQASTFSGDASAAVSPVAQPYNNTGAAQSGAATPDSASYSNAHTKTAWIDPVNITITSLTSNLRWPLYGAGGSLNARNNAYKFKYDGWSTSGTPTPRIGTVSGGWGTGGSETFRNNDFEQYVIGIFGPSGYAACGFSTATAVFKHNVHINGYRNGSYKSTWSDSKAGGCSNLVHHRTSNGFGWTS